ncbi:cellulose biosynthesis protein BcsN [Sinorhizobium medicae]|uniref:cellulose biosynthesis protein BcsN n=2 Tax=Sinorhizobium medicae TaxID=110321 RepID=UPI000C7DB692|nr:cellulose biosynthesis protein BcsN [Sinorhizobium medicae]PLU20843.1 hypothetical protein BMJ31_17570 [Sinorhizobium medicae]PLU33319.1 hypothetical protein BMJ26_24195 [Sinorhizobium medicae]PLU52409.1 hypothetical protein BMJ24_28105 [Sinorhizobium medicae]PLU72850.1 hypothetical protein BMJ20_05025 [Sinorhizobium medicae]
MAKRLLSRRFGPPVILLCILITGCTAREGVRMPTAAAMVPAENALVLPPPGGPSVLSVVERRTSNAVEQDIYLYTSAATPGQNFLRVQFFGPVGTSSAQERTAYIPIRSPEMLREAYRAIPGAALRQTADYLQNNYGPFSYAFGRGRGNDSCLYAWQQIRPPQHRRSPLRDYGTIQIHLRYCKTGATESELLAAVYGYTILGTFADPDWNPYGEPPAVDPALGRAGNPIYWHERPLAAAGAPIQPVRLVRSAPELTSAIRPELQQETAAPTETVVPTPTGSPQMNPPVPSGNSTIVVPTPACGAQPASECP